MNGITSITFLIASFVVVCHGHYNGRLRNNMHPMQNFHRDYPSSCSCSCDDLGALVTLVRTLEEKECSSSSPPPNGNINNADSLIMNLVNALIQLSTQALSRNSCHCPNQSGANNNPTPSQNGGSGNNNYNGGSGNNNNNGYSHSDGGLLNLDVLNPNKKDNVLDLDLNRQHLLGVGLGGGGSGKFRSSDSYNTSGRSASGANDEGLINVDLLNTNKKHNVAQVDLGNQSLVGVDLGGSGNPPSPPTNSMAATVSNVSNTEEVLINVDLLNSNKQNNVTDAEIANHSVIGIELGNKNDSTV